MTAWLDDGDVQLYHGSALEVLRSLPAGSAQTCVTSPPYWGLRSYLDDGHADKGSELGLERTPTEYVAALVAVFAEVWRVLRADGTLWLNLGDSYVANPSGGLQGSTLTKGGQQNGESRRAQGVVSRRDAGREPRHPIPAGDGPSLAQPVSTTGCECCDAGSCPDCGNGDHHGADWARRPRLKHKDLCGIPWRVAFALQEAGWYLRSDIIWAKPNPMPESVTDRPTKSHEYLFLLAKQPRYYYDSDAIREAFEARPQQRLTATKDQPLGGARVAAGVQQGDVQGGKHRSRFATQDVLGATERADSVREVPQPDADTPSTQSGRNARSVWEMEQVGRPNGARHSLNDAYFATIETPEQAYWLGFLYADGYIGQRHTELQLAEKDADHVLRFRTAIGSSHTFTVRNGRARVVVASKRMAGDLRHWGMADRARIPDIADSLVPHFVRGVFDGDGSAWKSLPAGRSTWRYAAQFLGTAGILAEIGDLLGLRGTPKSVGGIHRLNVASAGDLERLYDFMYGSATTVWLERKRIEFRQAQTTSPDVWPIATQPTPDAHFATFPEALVRRCILAGTSEAGGCVVCGAPWQRESKTVIDESRPPARRNILPPEVTKNGQGTNAQGSSTWGHWTTREHGEWMPSCACGAPAVPQMVLDPFVGSGTTALVARKLGRRAIGVDLSADYLEIAARRLGQQSLFAQEMGA